MKKAYCIGHTIDNPNQSKLCIPDRIKSAKVEHFGVIIMDSGRKVLDVKVLYKGGVGSCVVDIKPILWAMAKKNATCAIVFHNHPSGNIEPSDEDKSLTKRLQSAFNVCCYHLLDHIIVAKNDWYSFKENDALTSEEKLEEKVADLLRG